ncbi:MAG: formylglycine-generating enzyme family protein [Bacteroidota bacterium]
MLKSPYFIRYNPIYYLLLTIGIFLPSLLLSNNISVANVSLTGQDVSAGTNNIANFNLVQFDLSWDNSWRISTGANNWDAAWVFVKYMVGSSGVWQHATINYVDGTAANDGHTQPSGATVETANDGMGVFVYRDADGSGTFSLIGIELRWNYGADGVQDNDIVDVQVFAIEMVYVPAANFYVGDGTENTVAGQLHDAADVTTPFQITGEGSITLGGTTTGNMGNNDATGQLSADDFDESTTQTLPANFPKGYSAFYCMKYEISQGQYTDFLNSLTRTQQQSRTESDVSTDAITNIYALAGYSFSPARNTIYCPSSGNGTISPIIFSCNTPDRACNYLHWKDGFAYADWAGLRPMTELEFEKACRGTINPIIDEYAWGTTNIHASNYTLINDGTSSEGFSNTGANTGNAFYTAVNNSIGQGPVRVGIFAASVANKTREETGGTFYGIMEMSGNLPEVCIPIGTSNARNYTGIHGDGELTTGGESDVTGWPSNYFDIGIRGGDWANADYTLRISQRNTAHFGSYPNARNLGYGFRCIKTAN